MQWGFGMCQWYCSIDGRKYGPATTLELRQWLADGRLKPADHVWTDGMDDWALCNTVEEFISCTSPMQSNSKANAGMVLGIVSLPLVFLTPIPLYFSIFCLMIPAVCIFVCIWLAGGACAITGLCLSVTGNRLARETGSSHGMSITGITLSCVTLVMMVLQIVLVSQLWR